MKVIEKFCFPLKTSINGYMDMQIPFFYFYLFLFEKSSLKYHFALLISYFSLRQGNCKVIIAVCWVFLSGISIFPIRSPPVNFLKFMRDVRKLIN